MLATRPSHGRRTQVDNRQQPSCLPASLALVSDGFPFLCPLLSTTVHWRSSMFSSMMFPSACDGVSGRPVLHLPVMVLLHSQQPRVARKAHENDICGNAVLQ